MEKKINDPFASMFNNTEAENKPVEQSIVPVESNTNELPQLSPNVIETINTALQNGAHLQIVPKGSKGIIVRKEFNDEIKTRIEEIKQELTPLTTAKIGSQDDVVKINASLKKAKTLSKALENERKLMSSVLDDEKKELINYQETIGGELANLISIINNKVVAFQTAEAERQRKLQEEIERKKQEELERIRKENERIANIKNLILEFERNVLNAIHNATINDVDAKIDHLKKYKLKADVYQEFLPDAESMLKTCLEKFEARKKELLALEDLAKRNKEAADALKVEQEAKAAQEKEEQRQKEENEKAALEEKIQNDISNTQMESELKTSMMPKQKGVQKRWTFDETKVDLSLLPDEYKTFDAEKIKEAIAEGAREIPGVVIFEKIINVSR